MKNNLNCVSYFAQNVFACICIEVWIHFTKLKCNENKILILECSYTSHLVTFLLLKLFNKNILNGTQNLITQTSKNNQNGLDS